jgi:cysteine desulfurase
MAQEAPRLAALRDRLECGIFDGLGAEGVVRNGNRELRLPHTSNLSFAWVEGESLMMAIKEIAVSSGSACTSASLEPSYVLRSLGVSDELAHSSIRFGLGRGTTAEEIEYAIEHVVKAVIRLREMSPLYELAKETSAPAKAQTAAIKAAR